MTLRCRGSRGGHICSRIPDRAGNSGLWTSSNAPTAFRDRDPLALCGEVVLDQGDTIPIAAMACLESAASGAGAELAVARPTTEGDPIITFYRVAPTIDGVDLFIDSSRDAWGSADWAQKSCPTGSTIGEYGECSVESLPNPAQPGVEDE